MFGQIIKVVTGGFVGMYLRMGRRWETEARTFTELDTLEGGSFCEVTDAELAALTEACVCAVCAAPATELLDDGIFAGKPTTFCKSCRPFRRLPAAEYDVALDEEEPDRCDYCGNVPQRCRCDMDTTESDYYEALSDKYDMYYNEY